MFPGLTGWNTFVNSFNSFFPVLRKYIDAHKKSYNENNIRDLIDVYLQKIYSVKDKESPFYQESGGKVQAFKFKPEFETKFLFMSREGAARYSIRSLHCWRRDGIGEFHMGHCLLDRSSKLPEATTR
jgi:hypothetical protein